MFLWIGVAAVIVTVIVTAYRVLKAIYVRTHRRSLTVRYIVKIVATITVAVMAVFLVLVVIGFAISENTSRLHKNNGRLPVAPLDDNWLKALEGDWPHIKLDRFDTKIVEVRYGFTDVVTAVAYNSQQPDELQADITRSPHKFSLQKASFFYEKMLCGSGGDLLLDWYVSSESLRDFHIFCAEVHSDNVEVSEFDFGQNEAGSSLTIRRIGKSSYFIVDHCFRCY